MTALRSSLRTTTVADAMTPGVIACGPEATLEEVARLMASYRVHAVAVYRPHGERRVWAFVSDADILAAAHVAGFEQLTAGAIAGTEPLVVDATDTLAEAARLLAEHQCSHAVVLRDDSPAGVISSLDVIRRIATSRRA